jgi:hypothetical protein
VSPICPVVEKLKSLLIAGLVNINGAKNARIININAKARRPLTFQSMLVILFRMLFDDVLVSFIFSFDLNCLDIK